MVTKGDVILDSPLAKIGGKGLFVKELEKALLEKRCRYCCPFNERRTDGVSEGLGLSVICKREDPRDAFVSNTYRSLDDFAPRCYRWNIKLTSSMPIKTITP